MCAAPCSHTHCTLKLAGKLVLQYFQIMCMLETALDLKCSKFVSATANVASASNLDVVSLFPTSCAFVLWGGWVVVKPTWDNSRNRTRGGRWPPNANKMPLVAGAPQVSN